MLTASKLPNEKFLNIHLVDGNIATTARNILIVHIILSTDFESEKVEDVEYLWHLWYSSFWDDNTNMRFVRDLKNRKSNFFIFCLFKIMIENCVNYFPLLDYFYTTAGLGI